MTGRSKCVPGCLCKKHTPAPKAKCPEGCTCGRHRPPRKYNWASEEDERAYKRLYMKAHRANDPERHRKASREWSQRNPYWVKYRMSKDDWETLFADQSGSCYLCGDELVRDSQKSIHVDHDHSCCPNERSCGGCIRGLACSQCNQGIGRFKDDPERMRRVADTLEAANTRVRSTRTN